MSKSESCDPKYILQTLEATKEQSNKLSYISDTMERCPISDTPIKRKKRGMSGYNCYNRVQYNALKKIAEQKNEKPISYIKMVKLKGWNQEKPESKTRYNHMAEEGCPPRLWGG